MKTPRKRRLNLTEAEGSRYFRATKCTKKFSGWTSRAGQNVPPPDLAKTFLAQHEAKFPDSVEMIPKVDLSVRKVLPPMAKMKLQLFPIDKCTRETLMKDGFYPYLELILSSRKKVSSVLKHIHSKWNGSSIAQGESVLYPYDKSPALTTQRWTSDSSGITIGDIYGALGRPAVFQLRYGWMSGTENQTSRMLSMQSASGTNFHFEKFEKTDDDRLKNTDQSIITIAGKMNRSLIPSLKCEATKSADSEKAFSHGAVLSNGDGLRKDCSGVALNILDDMANLSVGDLLAEASLKGRSTDWGKTLNIGSTGSRDNSLLNFSFSHLLSNLFSERVSNSIDTKTNEKGLQDNKLVTASNGCVLSEVPLEARINECAHMNEKNETHMASAAVTDASAMGLKNEPLRQRSPHLESCSSILDAEDTCHAFPSKDFSSSGKDAAFVGGNVKSHPLLCEDADPKSFNTPNQAKAGVLYEACQKQRSETSLASSSQVYNQDNSLGLSGIKWSDSSVGPFGLSPSGKIVGEDSINFSNIVKYI